MDSGKRMEAIMTKIIFTYLKTAALRTQTVFTLTSTAMTSMEAFTTIKTYTIHRLKTHERRRITQKRLPIFNKMIMWQRKVSITRRQGKNTQIIIKSNHKQKILITKKQITIKRNTMIIALSKTKAAKTNTKKEFTKTITLAKRSISIKKSPINLVD